MILTGPIKLAGVLLGFASRETPVEAEWRPEHVARVYDGGRKEVVRHRWRLAGRFGWRGLTGTQAAQLRGLTDELFTLILRTRTDGDPSTYPEVEVLCTRTNPVEETRPLGRMANGVNVFDVMVEFEAVAVVEQIPGTIEGGYTLLGSEAVGHYTVYDIEPFGDATMVERKEMIDVDGTPRELTFYDLGPPELMPFVVSPDPHNALAWWIDTTGQWRLGTPKQDAELDP